MEWEHLMRFPIKSGMTKSGMGTSYEIPDYACLRQAIGNDKGKVGMTKGIDCFVATLIAIG